jgi:DNA (cytosine-5)-methyltransferase 1
MQDDSIPTACEFFAGGGMAHLGLRSAFKIAFANDNDPGKAAAYAENFGRKHFHEGDVWGLRVAQLPKAPALIWASFPCQDLSLAGGQAGIEAPRSGAFWGMWRLVQQLRAEGCAPPVLALENVSGLLASRHGAAFNALAQALAREGYTFGALEMDGADFTPQSRPRIFVVATLGDLGKRLCAAVPAHFHTPLVLRAYARLPPELTPHWRWWRLPAPPRRNASLVDLLDPDGDVRWRDQEATERMLSLMSASQIAKLHEVQRRGERSALSLFRRVRVEGGVRRQRAEARFDGQAGCLRTPSGGSSKQFVLVVEGDRIRSRLLTVRECARLMGLPDGYVLPSSATDAYKLLGDGVMPPVVAWLTEHLLGPLAAERQAADGRLF